MQERIAYLFKKFLNNTCSKEEFEEVFAFIKMAETDKEIRTLLDLTLADHHLGEADVEQLYVFVNHKGELEEFTGNQTISKERVKRKKQKPLQYSIIAFAAFVLAFVLLNYNSKQLKNITQEVTIASIKQATERSQYKHLLLPDSTEVWLNAASELEFPKQFNANKREVRLVGEAYFDVKHADKIPFIINTGKVTTEVLGTAFNIKAYPDSDKITVAVKRGKVKVNYINKQVALLGVGEQVSIAVNENIVKEKKLNEVEVSAWQQGKLVYDDYTVEDITKDLERVFGNSIQIASDTVKQLSVSTSFDKEMGLKKILEILCTLTDTRLSVEKNIYLMK